MPEGPELRMAALLVSNHGNQNIFGGEIKRSEAVKKKNAPEVTFKADEYQIEAVSRGKEMKVFLRDTKNKTNTSHILFRFGMSGCFRFSDADSLPKHAHVQFFTTDGKKALSFVDFRRFGKWEIEGEWGEERGPDAMDEPEAFRKNILTNLKDKAFNRPICEAMLNQKFFNGVGNYLRAEILYRCSVKPFDQARAVLEGLPLKKEEDKKEDHDLIDYCGWVMLEVVGLGRGKGYDVEKDEEAEEEFRNWTRCYSKEGMKNLVDANGRAIWYHGEPGSMVPKVKKSRARVIGTKEKAEIKKEKEELKKETKAPKRKIKKAVIEYESDEEESPPPVKSKRPSRAKKA